MANADAMGSHDCQHVSTCDGAIQSIAYTEKMTFFVAEPYKHSRLVSNHSES